MMEDYKFNAIDVVKHSLRFCYKKYLYVILTFALKFTVTYLIIRKTFEVVNERLKYKFRITPQDIIRTIIQERLHLLLFLILVVSTLCFAFLASVIRNYTNDERQPLLETIKITIKSVFSYMLGRLLFGFVSLLLYVLLVYMILTPVMIIAGLTFINDVFHILFNPIYWAAYIVFILFLGKFYYLPYTAFFQGRCSDIFEDTNDYIKKHYQGSMLFIITFGLPYLYLLQTQLNIVVTKPFTLGFFIIFLLIEIYKFFVEIIRITYIARAIREYNSIDYVPDLFKVYLDRLN